MLSRKNYLTMAALTLAGILVSQAPSVYANESYQVQAGDNLYRIALNHGTTIEAIKEANQIDGSSLPVGMNLVIPASADELAPEVTESVAPESENSQVDESQAEPSNPVLDESVSETSTQPTADESVEETKPAAKEELTTGFKTNEEAIKYAKDNFDWHKHSQWRVEWKDGKFEVHYDLKDPQNQRPTPKPTPKPAPSTSSNGYKVQAGDSYYKIANKYGVTVDALKKANNATSNFLQVGDKLVIPGSTSPAQPSPRPSESGRPSTSGTYTVQAGDYYYKIANKYGVTVDALKKANNATSNFLQVGDKLVIPGSTSPAQPSSRPSDSSRPSTSGTYTVQAGDYYYKIANKYGVTVEALKKANNATSNFLQVGDKLVIPGSTSPAQPSPRPSTSGTYTVQAGDYYYKIANKYGVTVDALKKANNATSNFLQVGDKLVIPGVTSQVRPSQPSRDQSTGVSGGTYTVQAGDYYYKIANKYGVTVDALKKANNATSNFLQVGDKLVIPGVTSQVRPSQPSRNQSTGASGGTYTVQAGDYYYKIAKKYGVTVDALKKANNASSNFLQIGDKLVIPKR
ncbi:LysM peptidoglycan-binding domain-containing protein [Hutsoniella sourekii]